MWSFAIILWELYTREIPFENVPPMKCGLMVSFKFTQKIKIKYKNYYTIFIVNFLVKQENQSIIWQ